MDAFAACAHRHERDHCIVGGADLRLTNLTADGSVNVTVKTNDRIDLSGNYFIRLTFTAEEIERMYRQSLAGTIKAA
jgi:hypothetical protein